MSWKLAELKWRQDLGLYESRWEMRSSTLPVERKRAIQAFKDAESKPRNPIRPLKCRQSPSSCRTHAGLDNKAVHPYSSSSAPDIEGTPVLTDEEPAFSSLVPLLRASSSASDGIAASHKSCRSDHKFLSQSTTRSQSSSALWPNPKPPQRRIEHSLLDAPGIRGQSSGMFWRDLCPILTS